MFLWVSVVLKALPTAIDEEDFMELLDEIPKEITALYKKELARLADVWISETNKVLIKKWVVLAERRLSVDELRVAVNISYRTRTGKKMGEYMIELKKMMMLLSLCSAFLEVDEDAEKGGNGTVSVIHSTFIKTVTDDVFHRSRFYVDRVLDNRWISRICTSYLAESEVLRQTDLLDCIPPYFQ